MDFLNSRGGLPRLWASLSSDYETILRDFMKQSGLHFADFAEVAKSNQITLLYHASLGARDKYHKVVGELILNCAKENWLNPGKAPDPFGAFLKEENEEADAVVTPTKSASTTTNNAGKDKKNAQVVIDGSSETKSTLISPQVEAEDKDVAFKYQLGGFYLTYLMYFRQPYQNFLKIKVDSNDLMAYRKFKTLVRSLSSKDVIEEIEFIMMRLKINQAFEIHGFADYYNIDPNTRAFLNCKKHPVTELIKADCQTQNALSYTKCVSGIQETFRSYLKQKGKFFSMGLDSLPALALPSTSVSLEGDETKASEVSPIKQELMANRGEEDTYKPLNCHSYSKIQMQDSLGVDDEDNPSKMDIKPFVGIGSISWIKTEKEWENSNGDGSTASGPLSSALALIEMDEGDVNMNRTLVETMESVNGVGEVAETAWRVQHMAEKPRFHHAALLGNEMVCRLMKQEAKKRFERVTVKIEQRKKGKEEAKAAKIPKKPYKIGAGVFGEVVDEDEVPKVPSRMKASFNLWNYIKGKGYNASENQL